MFRKHNFKILLFFITTYLSLLLFTCSAYGDELYTVSYNGNGISLGSNYSDQIKRAGDSITIIEYTPSTTADKLQTFIGWAIDPDATVPDYYPGDTYSVDQNAVLYAVWDGPYDLGTIDESLTIERASISKTWTKQWFSFKVAKSARYYFITDLSSSSSADGVYYAPVSDVYSPTVVRAPQNSPVSCSAELEAGQEYYLCLGVWGNQTWNLTITSNQAETFIVSYDGNGVTLGNLYSDQIKNAGESIQIIQYTPSTTADKLQTFIGWALDPDATVPDYYPGDTYSADQNAVLYAVWDGPYDLGTIDESLTIERGSISRTWTKQWFSFKVTKNAEYYVITDLSSSSSEDGIYYPPVSGHYGSRIVRAPQNSPVSCSAELEAGQEYYLCLGVWGNQTWNLTITSNQEETYTVSYDGNGVTLGNLYSDQIKRPGENIRIIEYTPETTAEKLQTFIGWALNPDATVPDYYPGDTYSADQNAVLYAVWDGPYDLGTIDESLAIERASISQAWTKQWFSFKVAKSAKYYFVTDLSSSSSEDGIYYPPVSGHYGSRIVRAPQNSPVSCSADLEAEQEYYLCLGVWGNQNWNLLIADSPDYHIHKWSSPSYSWSNNKTTVTASRYCTKCEVIETETVSAIRSVIKAPTKNETGSFMASGSDFKNKAFDRQTLSGDACIIPALKNLNVIIIPESLNVIEAEAFMGIDAEAIIIPNGCTAIGDKAFADCDNLIFVSVPEETRIAEDAFDASELVMVWRYAQ